MAISVSLAGPDELGAVREKAIGVAVVDPIGIGLLKHPGGRSGGGVGGEKVQTVLNAVHPLHGDLAGTGEPIDAGDQSVPSIAQIHPTRFDAAGDGHDAEAHVGVGSAGLGIALRLGDRAQAEQIHLRVDEFARGVELEIGEAAGIGRPPEGRTEVEFLRVDPIELAVHQSGRSVEGEAGGFLRSDVEGVKVVVDAKGDAGAVGRELGVALDLGRGGKLVEFPGALAPQEHVAFDAEQKLVACGGPGEFTFANAAVLPSETVFGAGLHGGAFEVDDQEQLPLGFRRRVVEREFSAAEIDEPLAAGRPNGRTESIAPTAAHGEDGVEGDRFLFCGGKEGNRK